MRVVNLAGRPFFNRRPVARTAVGLWIFGALLLAVNLWFWGSHFRGSSVSTERLEALERQVNEEETLIDGYWRQLRNVGLSARNQKAGYLNTLIHRRTFPWSRLFDELEDVLPANVYLVTVQPNVDLGKLPKSSRSARRPRRAITAREARRRAQEQAAGASSATRGSETTTAEAKPQEESRDKVTLTLKGVARTEEAMFDLVERLYGHESFLDPNLSSDATKDGVVEFNVKVVYLTPLRETFPVRIEELPPEEGAIAEGSATAEEGSPRGQTRSARRATGAGGDPEDAAVSSGESDELLSRRGPGFVEETLATRRQRAAERADELSGRGELEEGDEAENGNQRGRAVAGRSRPTPPGGASSGATRRPSRVSVAPRRGNAQRRGDQGQAPSGQVRGQAGSGDAEDTVETAPQRGTRRPPRRTPGSGDDGGRSVDRPEPAQPPASASPRLLGMLDLMPRFLRPELESNLYVDGRAAS